MGRPPAKGDWAAPSSVVAEAAGDRPAGVIVPAPAGPDRADAPAAPLSAAGRGLHDRFVGAIDDDLDLPKALAIVREILRADLPANERRWLVLDADAVLGLDLHRVWEARPRGAGPKVAADPAAGADPAAAGSAAESAHRELDLSDVTRLVEARSAARMAGDFARADALRDAITAAGWDVVDGSGGKVVLRRAWGPRPGSSVPSAVPACRPR